MYYNQMGRALWVSSWPSLAWTCIPHNSHERELLKHWFQAILGVLPLQSIFLVWKPLKSTQHPWIWVVRHKNRPNRSSSSKVMVNLSQYCDIEIYISLTRDPHPNDPRVSGQEKNLDPRVMTRGSPLLTHNHAVMQWQHWFIVNWILKVR